MHELRCKNKILFGRLAEGILEVKCRSRGCGYEPGVVVLHRFSVITGDLMDTKVFRDPGHRKGENSASDKGSTAVRSS